MRLLKRQAARLLPYCPQCLLLAWTQRRLGILAEETVVKTLSRGWQGRTRDLPKRCVVQVFHASQFVKYGIRQWLDPLWD